MIPAPTGVSLAHDYTQMSEVMLQVKREDGKLIFIGDLAFAEYCARAARDLGEETILMGGLADRQLQRVKQLQQAISQHPNLISLRPHYGPFIALDPQP
jgi:hypothetical protein